MPSLRRILRLVSSALGVASFLSAAVFALDPSKAITQYSYKAWTSEEGLPENSVGSIVQTRDGYLWLGTQEGLVRFDGVSFTVYDKRNTPAIRNNNIRALLEDREGNLWIGTNGGGLVRHREGRFETVTTREGLPHDMVMSLCQSRDGSLWIGTYGGGLGRYRDGRFTCYRTRDGLGHDAVLALCEDGGGGVWAGTNGGGLSHFQDGGFTTLGVSEGLPHPVVYALCRGRDGALWVGTYGGGLARLQGGRIETIGEREGLCGNRVLALYEDRDGSLWVGTFGAGLCRLARGRWSSFRGPGGDVLEVVRTIQQDREGSVWVGTDAGGFFRLHDGSFTTFSTQEGLSNNYAIGILEDREGALWIGTNGGGLNRFQGGRFESVRARDGLGSDLVRSAFEDPGGALWIGTDGGGLARLLGGRLATWTTREGLTSNRVIAVTGDRGGNLWVGTNGGGLLRMRDGRVVQRFSRETGLAGDIVSLLREDSRGNLWIGTYGGLSLLRNGQLASFEGQKELGEAIVCDLYEDPPGAYWLGTIGQGIKRLKGGQVRTCTRKDGLFDDVAFSVLDDGRGALWMSCNRGVYRVQKAELEAFFEGRRASVRSVPFGRADGLKGAECNGGFQPSGCRDRQGRLWFPTIRGVACVDPSRILQNRLPPPVHVETVVVNGSSQRAMSRVVLPPGRRRIEIHYTALSFVAPEKVRFQYTLEGFDAGWIDVESRRAAYYTNLPPGAYTFRVKGCNNDGVWSAEGASLELVLEPFFYQTPWFYCVCGLAAILLATGVYRLRLTRLRARQRELERLVQERTRDVEREKEKAEGLLLNILPSELVSELEASGSTTPKRHEEASILFTDFEGFSASASKMSPEGVVTALNEVFTAFDEIVARHGLEKIKTIGDAYMAAAGLPGYQEDHALRCVRAALDMQSFVRARNKVSENPWNLRVGIHTGPVVAGVVGKRKFAYDVWGDTVNIANRVEEACEPGRVNVSAFTYELVKEAVCAVPRGPVAVSGRRKVGMYYVESEQ